MHIWLQSSAHFTVCSSNGQLWLTCSTEVLETRYETHSWTLIQTGIRSSLSLKIRHTTPPPTKKKQNNNNNKTKAEGTRSLELNLSQSTDRSLRIAVLLQAALHHRLAAGVLLGPGEAHTPHRVCAPAAYSLTHGWQDAFGIGRPK